MGLNTDPIHVFACRSCGRIEHIQEIRVFSVDECEHCGAGPLCLKCCQCATELAELLV